MYSLKKKKSSKFGDPIVAQRVKKTTSFGENAGSILSLAQGVKDLALLWLWHRQPGVVPI